MHSPFAMLLYVLYVRYWICINHFLQIARWLHLCGILDLPAPNFLLCYLDYYCYCSQIHQIVVYMSAQLLVYRPGKHDCRTVWIMSRHILNEYCDQNMLYAVYVVVSSVLVYGFGCVAIHIYYVHTIHGCTYCHNTESFRRLGSCFVFGLLVIICELSHPCMLVGHFRVSSCIIIMFSHSMILIYV